MQRKGMIAVLAALTLAAGALAGYATLRSPSGQTTFAAVDVTDAPWGKDFQLTDHAGKRRTLADFRGKVVMLTFGFTHCPDMCPTTLATLAEATRRLGDDAGQVQGLFVTVDPKRDTPPVLAKYVPAFHPAFLGLYGDEAAIERTAKEFKIFYRAQPPNEQGAYSVDHSGQVYVIDKAGRLRLYIKSHDATPDKVAHDLRLLIGQGDKT